MTDRLIGWHYVRQEPNPSVDRRRYAVYRNAELVGIVRRPAGDYHWEFLTKDGRTFTAAQRGQAVALAFPEADR